jgi:5-methylthioadenosine/S-adenosylhomocysteine deaminase
VNVDLFVHGALIVLDLNAPHLRPLHDPWSTLGYAGHSADVRDTVVDGRALMRDRELCPLDERAVIADQEALV